MIDINLNPFILKTKEICEFIESIHTMAHGLLYSVKYVSNKIEESNIIRDLSHSADISLRRQWISNKIISILNKYEYGIGFNCFLHAFEYYGRFSISLHYFSPNYSSYNYNSYYNSYNSRQQGNNNAILQVLLDYIPVLKRFRCNDGGSVLYLSQTTAEESDSNLNSDECDEFEFDSKYTIIEPHRVLSLPVMLIRCLEDKVMDKHERLEIARIWTEWT